MATGFKEASKASPLRREISRVYQQAGFWGACWRGAKGSLRKLRSLFQLKGDPLHPFDLRYGTDTGGIIEAGALDIPDEKLNQAHRYQTAIVDVFSAALNDMPVRHEDFLFIDLGSGKGRALLLASSLPFKGIIGVELSETLTKTAQRNVEIYREENQRCRDIQCLCADASAFDFPEENIMIYLFNPFGEEVMRAVLSNLRASFRRHQRRIFVAYLKPLYRKLFDDADFLQLFRETDRYVIYRAEPNNGPQS